MWYILTTTIQAKLQTGSSYYVLNGEMYLAKMKAEFQHMDQDGNGLVNKEDLKKMALSLNYALSEEELETILNDMDQDQNGTISLEEFIAATVCTLLVCVCFSCMVWSTTLLKKETAQVVLYYHWIEFLKCLSTVSRNPACFLTLCFGGRSTQISLVFYR
jgi:EF-hand domain pair